MSSFLEIQQSQEEQSIFEGNYNNFVSDCAKKQREQINVLESSIEKFKRNNMTSSTLEKILLNIKIDRFGLYHEVQKYVEFDYLNKYGNELCNKINEIVNLIRNYNHTSFGIYYVYKGNNPIIAKKFDALTSILSTLYNYSSSIKCSMTLLKRDILLYKSTCSQYINKRHKLYDILLEQIERHSKLQSHVINQQFQSNYYQLKEQIYLDKIGNPYVKFIFFNLELDFNHLSHNIWNVIIEYLNGTSDTNAYDYCDGDYGLLTNSIKLKYKKKCVSNSVYKLNGSCYSFCENCYQKLNIFK